MRFLALIVALLVPLTSTAGLAAYKCKIEKGYQISDNGTTLEAMDWVKGEFMVDRRNGSIIGDWLPNATATSVNVVNAGDDAYSFTVVSIFGMVAEVLRVKEYAEGIAKPFIALEQTMLITGTCE